VLLLLLLFSFCVWILDSQIRIETIRSGQGANSVGPRLRFLLWRSAWCGVRRRRRQENKDEVRIE
jgi:hypothetical protein